MWLIGRYREVGSVNVYVTGNSQERHDKPSRAEIFPTCHWSFGCVANQPNRVWGRRSTCRPRVAPEADALGNAGSGACLRDGKKSIRLRPDTSGRSGKSWLLGWGFRDIEKTGRVWSRSFPRSQSADNTTSQRKRKSVTKEQLEARLNRQLKRKNWRIQTFLPVKHCGYCD